MVSEVKIKKHEQLCRELREAKVIGIVDFYKLPGAQMQSIRKGLRDIAKIKLYGKKIIIKSLEKVKNEKKGIEKILLQKEEDEAKQAKIPALIYSEVDSFELQKRINCEKSSIFAKGGDIATENIIVPKGDTKLPPGPAISDLKGLKIKAAIQGPKIVIMEDKTLVEAGEEIDGKIAEMLMKLEIKPMKITLTLKNCYEGGVIYDSSLLTIDLEKYRNEISGIYNQAFNLAYNIDYPVPAVVECKIGEATQQARNLAIEANIVSPDTIGQIMSNLNSKALGVCSVLPKEVIGDAKIEEQQAAPAKKDECEQEKPSEEEEKKSEEDAAAGLGALFG
ncbi:MAG: 50S ribosomal protein L10 [Candidatus Nanohalarchaeota archaeon]|nr:MAG: 50S ribosomal protein L10 [Candidatus Nanohaloarchaeota archaeon]